MAGTLPFSRSVSDKLRWCRWDSGVSGEMDVLADEKVFNEG